MTSILIVAIICALTQQYFKDSIMFINLTQHKMTEEQIQDALQVFKEPIHNTEPLNEVIQLITFNELPDYRLIQSVSFSIHNYPFF